MSWIYKLYETYENCQSMIGAGSDENLVTLLPIGHTTQMVQVEIAIDQDGNFKRARVVPKDKARTIIPCTESSGGRAGKKPDTHPLCDKLQYLANDFTDYGGVVTSGYTRNPKEPFNRYQSILKKWCESEYSHPKAKAVLKYTEKGNVIKDLVDFQILFIGTDGKLLKKWDKKNGEYIPDIFKVSANSSQIDAFVRWIVEIPTDPQSSVWNDSSLFHSWIDYYKSTKEEKNNLCYVTGAKIPGAYQHPAKLRNDGDKAKLISSNDISGFTFRGRFLTAEQACSVGYEVTQKAHNALRWLIGRQSYRRDSQAIVAWSTIGHDIPDPLADTFTMLEFDEMQSDSEPSASTAQEFALKLKKKIAGYSVKLDDTTGIVVMGLDSATPGRMAISFYRELNCSDFLNKLEEWHATCNWIHDYHKKEIVEIKTGKKIKLHVRFVGAPAPCDIAEVVYGRKVDDKLRKTTVERILPCIIDGKKLPRDLVELAIRRVSNRTSMEEWEWNKSLSIACALYRKYHEKEEFDMSLDENRNTRDYLYGRLLALADVLESWALSEAKENRQTNASRLMLRFSDHPYTTWRTIELSLEPYKARLGRKSFKLQNLISEVIAMFETDDFIIDKKLSGEFLLGYHCQRDAFWKKGGGEEQE